MHSKCAARQRRAWLLVFGCPAVLSAGEGLSVSTGREDAKRLKPGATDGPGWAGLPLVMLRGTRLTECLVVTAPAVTTHTMDVRRVASCYTQ